MISGNSSPIARIPSLRALYIFEAAARHLNLVRAGEELGLTQSALSRQIRQLEKYVGVDLFVRLPRGLAFTEAGDILRHHCKHAFRELNEGIATISGVQERRSLRIAVARSYATRVLSHRTASFVDRYPSLELILDGHRHLVALSGNEADAAIRVGDGRWSEEISSEKIEDDPIFPIASPALIARLGSSDVTELAEAAPLLHYMERPYWETWAKGAGVVLPGTKRGVRFSESIMTLEAAEAGQGLAIARHSLVREALKTGRLVRISDRTVDDGIAYYFCATPESARKEKVKCFREWLFSTAE